jgi:hypothetical protein
MDLTSSRADELEIICGAIHAAETRGGMTPRKSEQAGRNEKILFDYQVGNSLAQMSEAYHLSKGMIRSILKNAGVDKPKFKFPAEKTSKPQRCIHRKKTEWQQKNDDYVNEVRRAIGEGHTLAEVGRIFNISRQAVSSVCKTHHIAVARGRPRK